MAQETQIDAIIATNTTLDRKGLKSDSAGEKRWPFRAAIVRNVYARFWRNSQKLTDGNIPLIGVGGVGNAEQAYAKLCAGASAVQLYSALVYEGLSLVPRLNQGLLDLMARDGHATVADVIGTGRADWL